MQLLRAHSRFLGQGIPQVAHPSQWEIPIEHSVEPGRNNLITVDPRPIHGFSSVKLLRILKISMSRLSEIS